MNKQKEYKFILLKGEIGNIFWTTLNKDIDYEAEGCEILHKGNETKEMVAEWEKHYLTSPFSFNF